MFVLNVTVPQWMSSGPVKIFLLELVLKMIHMQNNGTTLVINVCVRNRGCINTPNLSDKDLAEAPGECAT